MTVSRGGDLLYKKKKLARCLASGKYVRPEKADSLRTPEK